MATFHFELVSPERLLFSGEVDQVDAPGAEGDFGIMAGHSPLVAMLRPGILTVTTGGQRQRIVVFGGVAEISASGMTVLADEAVAVEEFDAAAFAEMIKNTEEDATDTTDDVLRDKLRRKIGHLRAVQAAVTGGTGTSAH